MEVRIVKDKQRHPAQRDLAILLLALRRVSDYRVKHIKNPLATLGVSVSWRFKFLSEAKRVLWNLGIGVLRYWGIEVLGY